MSRMQRRVRKIRDRLKASTETDWIGEKPKGMHWKTFERLRQQEDVANDRADLAWVARASKFLERSARR